MFIQINFILSLIILTKAWQQNDLFANNHQLNSEICGLCELKKCPPLTKCNAGIVRDRCNCCNVCGLEESQLCNKETDLVNSAREQPLIWHGLCGTDLECRDRTDVDEKLVGGKQSICYCVKEGKVCGSDGITYSKCKMNATIVSSNGLIRAVNEGPCQTAPTILLNAPLQPIADGTNVTLICESRGYPIPTVTWYFNKPGYRHHKQKLPDNFKDITVSIRGGPQETHTVSFLQLTNFALNYEGEYECMADNEIGMKAQVVALVRDSPKWKQDNNNDEKWSN